MANLGHGFTRESLKDLGNRPRVHGNGFIQLDLDAKQRLHVWGHPGIPKQKRPSTIHDHIFSFISTVLVGRLVNVVYRENMLGGNIWDVYTAICREGENTVLKKSQIAGEGYTTLSPAYVESTSEDDFYFMEKGVFHETFVTCPTATIIEKTGSSVINPNGPKPRVLVAVGQEPDNDFDRHAVSEDTLWGIIFQVLEI